MQCNCVRFCYQTLFLVLVRREGIEQECEGEGGVHWKQQVTSSWKVGRTVSPRVSGVILAQLPQMRPMKWAQTRRFLELLLFSQNFQPSTGHWIDVNDSQLERTTMAKWHLTEAGMHTDLDSSARSQELCSSKLNSLAPLISLTPQYLETSFCRIGFFWTPLIRF